MLKNMLLHLYDSDKLSSALPPSGLPQKSLISGAERVEGAGTTITGSGEIGNLKRNTHQSEKLLSLISPLKENWNKVKRRQHWDRNWKQCLPIINQKTIHVFIHKNFFSFLFIFKWFIGWDSKDPSRRGLKRLSGASDVCVILVVKIIFDIRILGTKQVKHFKWHLCLVKSSSCREEINMCRRRSKQMSVSVRRKDR